MPFEPIAFLLLMLLGGVVAVDGTSFGQFMISRPLVAASLAGWLVGEPVLGALVGVILETFHLAVLPVGAAKYPEGGPAAAAAGAVFASSDQLPSTLLLLVVGTLLIEWVSGESVRYLRQANVRLLQADRGAPASVAGMEWRHRAAIGMDFVRGVVLVGIGAPFLVGIALYLAPLWGLGERVAEVLLMAAVAGMLASAFRVVGSRTWFAAVGAAAGAIFLLLSG